jgi:hypothetical protein
MRATWRSGVVTVGITVALMGVTGAEAADPSPDKVAAGQLVTLINQERAAAGLAPLGVSDVAVEVAESWSVHMAATRELAHNESWFSAETRARAGAKAVGENVAFNGDVIDAHRRLMESPGHRANILDGRFHQLGVGAVRDADGMWWITEDFLQLRVVDDAVAVVPIASPVPAPVRPAPAPSPRPPPPPAELPRGPGEPDHGGPADTPSPSLQPIGSSEDEGAAATLGADGLDADAWSHVRDAIEVASGQRLIAPSATATGAVPVGFLLAAVAGVATDAALLHRHRRRRHHRHAPSKG